MGNNLLCRNARHDKIATGTPRQNGKPMARQIEFRKFAIRKAIQAGIVRLKVSDQCRGVIRRKQTDLSPHQRGGEAHGETITIAAQIKHVAAFW